MAKRKSSKKPLRPLGEILLEIEVLRLEAVEGHDLQMADWIGAEEKYWYTHLDAFIEKYLDGTRPVLYYGHVDGLIEQAEHYKKLRGKK